MHALLRAEVSEVAVHLSQRKSNARAVRAHTATVDRPAQQLENLPIRDPSTVEQKKGYKDAILLQGMIKASNQ
jgi:hypothetical protein